MTRVTLSPSLSTAYTRLIDERFGMRLLASQIPDLDRLVVELLPESGCTGPDALYDAFAAGALPHMLERLGGQLAIGETTFFRVLPQIEALRHAILPDLIARHTADRRLRVWSAGCSTGEEAYTLAMLVREQIPAPETWDIQVVGSDIDQDALEVARLAVYGEWSFRGCPPDQQRRYFTASGDRWQLIDPVRRMVRFAQLNLAQDASPWDSAGQLIDLIVCRFVTIYFGKQASQRLYRRFAASLQPSGWLLLGPSDPVPVSASGFDVQVLNQALTWRPRQAVSLGAPVQLPSLSVPDLNKPLAAERPSGMSMAGRDYLSTGMLQLDQGDAAGSIGNLRRAAFLDDSSALAQFCLGRAYRKIGDLSRSRSAFSRARRLLVGVEDDQPLDDRDAARGDLRVAVEAQLAELNKTEQ